MVRRESKIREVVYGFGDYDQYYSLRPGFNLTLILLYLSRSFLLPFLAAAFGSGRGGNMNYILEAEHHPILFLGCSTPALLVAIALFARVPKAGFSIRFIWRWGRWLLLLSALMDGAGRVWADPHFHSISTVWFFSMDTISIFHLLLVRRVGDVFRDFPAAEIDSMKLASK